MVYSYNANAAANDWFFTRGLNLTAGTSYKLTFKYKSSFGPTYVEKLEVKYGTSPNAAAMTSAAIFTNTNINIPLADPYLVADVNFTPPATGVYYLGFRVFSDADQADLLVDDIAVTQNPLPVTLSNFKGERIGATNKLTWSTFTEVDNHGFEIQRSIDGVSFNGIHLVPSKANRGNSTSVLDYSFDDSKPFVGSNYYRLKQIDKDGKVAYSNIVLLKGARSSGLQLSAVYPNPVRSVLNFVVASPSSEIVNLVITDLSGKAVIATSKQLISGDNNIQLPVSKLTSGSYIIKVICHSGCESVVGKFVKQ
jgi:hypothetical protein